MSKLGKWIGKRWGNGPSVSGLKSSIKGAAKNPLTYAALAAPFAPAIVGAAKGIGMAGAAKVGGLFKGASSVAGAADDIGLDGGDIASSGGGRFRRIVGGVGGFLGGKDGFDMDDLLKYGTAAGKAYGAYDDMNRRGRYEDIAMDEFRRRAPLRDKSMAMLMDESVPDTSDLRDPLDPAGRYRRVRVGSAL